MSLSILWFYLYDQKYDRKIELRLNVQKSPEMFFADGTLLYSWHKIYDVFISQIVLFSTDTSWKFLLLSLKTTYQYLFTFASIFVLRKAG